MPFARVGTTITQTGTDNDLSGLTAVANNNVTQITVGQKTIYSLPLNTSLVITGSLSFYAVREAVATDTLVATGGNVPDGLRVAAGGELNIEGRIHETITDASQVADEIDGAVFSNEIANYYNGQQRQWHAFRSATAAAGAFTIDGTLNAVGVTLVKGRGGFSPNLTAQGSVRDCTFIIEDDAQNEPANRAAISRLRSPGFDMIRCRYVGSSLVIQHNRIESANPGEFDGMVFTGGQRLTTDPGIFPNTSANPFEINNPSFVNKATEIGMQSNDVAGPGGGGTYTQNLPIQIYVQNAENGSETIARPTDPANFSWGYCNFGKHVTVNATVLNGTPADTEDAIFFCQDQPSDFATRNQKTTGTFATGVYQLANNASITGQAENAQITYFRRLSNTGSLTNTASFGTPANTERVIVGILDMPFGTQAGNLVDTGNTRIDRRGNATDNTSTSAEKRLDNFTFFFYRRDYDIIETTQSLKGNGVQEFTPIFLPDSFYGGTDFTGSKTTALTTQEVYDYEKFRKGSNSTDFALPTPGTLYVNGAGTTLNFGALTVSVGQLPNPTQAVAFGSTSAVIQTGGPALLPTDDLNGIETTGEMTLSGIDVNAFTFISAGSFAQVPLLTSETLTIAATDPGMGTSGPETRVLSYNGGFVQTGGTNTAGQASALSGSLVVHFIDDDEVDNRNFLTQLVAGPVGTGDTVAIGNSPARTISAIQLFDNSIRFTIAGADTFIFGTQDLTFVGANINAPGMRPINSIPNGGDYGATFSEGRWQLTDAVIYEFSNGAFTETDAELVGPDSGTAIIRLALNQTLMDIAGVATIDNIDAQAVQAQPTALRINFTNQLVGAEYSLWRGLTNIGDPIASGSITDTSDSIRLASAAITDTTFTVDPDVVGDYVIGFSSVTGATTYHAFSVVENTLLTSDDQAIVLIVPGAQPDQSAIINTTVSLLTSGMNPVTREVVVEDARVGGRIAFDLHSNNVADRPSAAQIQRQFAIARQSQNYLRQQRQLMSAVVFEGADDAINSVISRDAIQFVQGGVNGRNGDYILTDTGDTTGAGGSPGVQIAAGFYDATGDNFDPRATIGESLGLVTVFDAGSENPHVIAERRGIGVTVAQLDESSLGTVNTLTTVINRANYGSAIL